MNEKLRSKQVLRNYLTNLHEHRLELNKQHIQQIHVAQKK